MDILNISVEEFLSIKSWNIVLDKVLMIRGLSYESLADNSHIVYEDLINIRSGSKNITKDEENQLLEAIGFDHFQWRFLLKEVKKLLLDGENDNSIEIWNVIIKSIYEEEGKFESYKAKPDDSPNWDT